MKREYNHSMPAGDNFDLLQGYSDTTTVFRLQISKSSGVFRVRIGARIDPWTWAYSNWYALTGGWNALERFFLPGDQSGEMCLWLGGEQKQCLNGLDADGMQLDAIRMGAEGVDIGRLCMMGTGYASSKCTRMPEARSRRTTFPRQARDCASVGRMRYGWRVR